MGIVTGALIAAESVGIVSEADAEAAFECALITDVGITGLCIMVKLDQEFHEHSDKRDQEDL